MPCTQNSIPHDLTDSMKMFKMGVDGGRPANGTFGAQPEWGYKGDGSWVVPPGGALERPAFAQDGGEEAEIAGLYVIGDSGEVLRVGFALANEFSDHIMERENYLLLAHSKLRTSSFGPELRLGPLPSSLDRNDPGAAWGYADLAGRDAVGRRQHVSLFV